MLQALRSKGFGVSIDDFGTGYSSLAYLRELPANELKVDRAFVARMQVSEQDRELVQIIVNIAHLYNMAVVAEGIEDQETLEALKATGCDTAQGYFFARPMSADRLSTWLAERRLQQPDPMAEGLKYEVRNGLHGPALQAGLSRFSHIPKAGC